ncbi:MAG: dihydrodipicolinate synthase family protein [Gammaproteobacteria bacterium]|nr:dihydrodipicolinate synthase family protein [Gammaproteobacteria bacterium]
MTDSRLRGLLVPVATPFGADLEPDGDSLVAHCRWLLEHGADGLALFGTTSEANSLGVDERIRLLETVLEAGIDARRLMPGTGACALVDAAKLTGHAVAHGCGGVLMLPPFYYKAVGTPGLLDFFLALADRVGDARLRLYLYHIPQVAGVGIPRALVDALASRIPGTLAGLKDSSGDWEHTSRLLEDHPELDVFPGSETFLLDGLRHGGAGCITATGNVNPRGIRAVLDRRDEEDADALQASATAIRRAIEAYPMIPAVKALLARIHGTPGWQRVRPPLVALDEAAATPLWRDAAAAGLGVA